MSTHACQVPSYFNYSNLALLIASNHSLWFYASSVDCSNKSHNAKIEDTRFYCESHFRLKKLNSDCGIDLSATNLPANTFNFNDCNFKQCVHEAHCCALTK